MLLFPLPLLILIYIYNVICIYVYVDVVYPPSAHGLFLLYVPYAPDY